MNEKNAGESGKQSGTATIRDLYVLYRNSHLSKFRHFAAGIRMKRWNSALSLLVVFINIGLGSIFFALLSVEIPNYAKWCGAFLALLAALSSGASSSYNFSGQFEGHRSIANRYLAFGRRCELLLSQYFDELKSLEDVSRQLPDLHSEYHAINVDAERLPTREVDYRKARQQEEHRQKQLSWRVEFLKEA